MHYHLSSSHGCACRWLILVAAVCFALETLFPHAAVAQVENYTVTSVVTPRAFPVAGPRAARYTSRVLVTAYSSTPDQTDDTPFITASGSTVRRGVVAANFLRFGTQVRLPEYFGNDVFVVEDRMHERFSNRLDIWMESRAAARAWGVRYVTIEIL